MDATPVPVKAPCPQCGLPVGVRPNGALYRHKLTDGTWCPGGGMNAIAHGPQPPHRPNPDTTRADPRGRNTPR